MQFYAMTNQPPTNISEETVFVDPADSLIDRVLQSPRYSEKEWMVYGSSNDEYCYEQSSDNDTQDTSSDIEISSGSKRQKHEHQLFHVYDSEGRIHGELGCTDVSNRYTSYSYSKKMKPKPQDAQVDVRIIDFAHTSFVHGSTCNSTSMVYQGPDSGFLTGLDSLRRLLLEILTEG